MYHKIQVINKPHEKFQHEEGSIIMLDNDIFEWCVKEKGKVNHYWVNIPDEIEKGNFEELHITTKELR